MNLTQTAWKLSTAEDAKVPLHYITKQVLRRLNLERISELPVSEDMLQQALTSKRRVWYLPETREIVVNDLQKVFANTKLTPINQDRLRLLNDSTVVHELVHDKVTSKEYHYYKRNLLVRPIEALQYIFGEKSLDSLVHEAYIIATRVEEASYPQEWEAISQQEEYLVTKLGRTWNKISPFRNPRKKLKELEDTRLEQGFTCKYLLPFIMEEEFKKMGITMKDLGFRMVYRGVDRGPKGEVYSGPMCVAPDMVWVAASTIEENKIEQGDFQNILIERIIGNLKSAKYIGPLREQHQVSIEEVYFSNREAFWKEWLNSYFKKHWNGSNYSLFAIMFGKRLQKVLDSMYIVWEVGHGRWLCANQKILDYEEPSLIKTAKGLMELCDEIFTPLLYTIYLRRTCAEKPKCSIFKAIVDKTRIPWQILPSDRYVPDDFVKHLETDRGELAFKYKWLWNEANKLGKKLAKVSHLS